MHVTLNEQDHELRCNVRKEIKLLRVNGLVLREDLPALESTDLCISVKRQYQFKLKE